jgi:hypothetical protein
MEVQYRPQSTAQSGNGAAQGGWAAVLPDIKLL